jgi:hypothetical protein
LEARHRGIARLTLGSTTASLINSHYTAWIDRGVCPEFDWLFVPTPMRANFMTADALSHKFRRLGASVGVSNPALHRLRHGVATYLVDQGKLLKAQARLGHSVPSTTLRHYSHITAPPALLDSTRRGLGSALPSVAQIDSMAIAFLRAIPCGCMEVRVVRAIKRCGWTIQRVQGTR